MPGNTENLCVHHLKQGRNFFLTDECTQKNYNCITFFFSEQKVLLLAYSILQCWLSVKAV